jgi:hypothetical protein
LIRPLAILPVLLLLNACSSQVFLTIESDPSGAAVYEGGELHGITPITLNYAGDDEGCIATRPIRVAWKSGAEARVSAISLCPTQDGEAAYTFTYPEGFRNAEQDRDEKLAATSGRRVSPNGELYYEVETGASSGAVRCFSSVEGDRVNTTCGG